MRLDVSEPMAWRECSDSLMIADLAEASPFLTQAKRLASDKPAEAKRLVVRHALERAGSHWLFDHRLKPADTFVTRNYFWGGAITLDEARTVLDFRVRDPNCRAGYHDLGPEVEWERGLIHLYGSSGWLVLHFWYWALFASAGFALERDDRYVQVFTTFWRRWHEDFPFYVEHDVVKGGGAFSRADSCMRAGRRVLVLTDLGYSGLLGALPTELAFDVLKYIWFVSRQYVRLPRTPSGGFRYHSGNHNLFDVGTTPYCLGLAWPEFSHSQELAARGKAIIRHHVRSSIHGDGTSVEHSTRYAWYIANMYVQAVELARLNGDDLLRPQQEEKLRRFMWTLVELTGPDGKLIPYGDCQPPPDGLQLRSYRSLFNDDAIDQRADALGVKMKASEAPVAVRRIDEPTSFVQRSWKLFLDSGMLIVRDGVDPNSSLLWITADPRGQTGHGHMDPTSFQLWVEGRPLILDTSGFGYRIEEINSEERAFYYSLFGHSLLTVDGYTPESMERMGSVTGWWGKYVPESHFTEIDIHGVSGRVCCEHRIYPGMLVERTFEFDLAEKRLDVCDRVRVERGSAGEHAYRQAFHLAFGLVASVRESGLAASARGEGVRAEFAWDGRDIDGLRVVSEPSRLAQRAADVFHLRTPHILTAEVTTSARDVSIACRLQWE